MVEAGCVVVYVVEWSGEFVGGLATRVTKPTPLILTAAPPSAPRCLSPPPLPPALRCPQVHAGPFVAVDLCPFLCAQPTQLFIKDLRSGQPLLNVLIWHRRLLYPEAGDGDAPPKKSKGGVFGGSKGGGGGGGGSGGGEGGGSDGGGGGESEASLAGRFKGLLSGWRTSST